MEKYTTNPVAGTELSSILAGIDFSKNCFFEILIEGTFKPDQIITSYNPVGVDYPTYMRQSIEAEWERLISRNPNAFPGPMIRLDTIGVSDGHLVLGVGETNYKDYLGTLALILNDKSRKGLEYFAHPLAATMVVHSKTMFDGRGGILFSQRSQSLAQHPGELEFPSGNVEKGDIDQRGYINPVITALRETEEEQGIRKDDLENIRVLGVEYEIYNDAAPVVVVAADLKDDVKIDEVVKEESDQEGRQIWLPDNPEALTKLLMRYSLMSLPLSQAGLYLYFKSNFPEGDYAEVLMSYSRRRAAAYSKLLPEQIEELVRRKKLRFSY